MAKGILKMACTKAELEDNLYTHVILRDKLGCVRLHKPVHAARITLWLVHPNLPPISPLKTACLCVTQMPQYVQNIIKSLLVRLHSGPVICTVATVRQSELRSNGASP